MNNLKEKFPRLSKGQLEFIETALYEYARWVPKEPTEDEYIVDKGKTNEQALKEIEEILGFTFAEDMGRDG